MMVAALAGDSLVCGGSSTGRGGDRWAIHDSLRRAAARVTADDFVLSDGGGDDLSDVKGAKGKATGDIKGMQWAQDVARRN